MKKKWKHKTAPLTGREGKTVYTEKKISSYGLDSAVNP